MTHKKLRDTKQWTRTELEIGVWDISIWGEEGGKDISKATDEELREVLDNFIGFCLDEDGMTPDELAELFQGNIDFHGKDWNVESREK